MTIVLLKHLAHNGHKVSLSKLQFAHIGHVITAEPKSLSPKCIQAIQAMTFLGITSYYGQWIPNYLEREAPLFHDPW